MRELSNGLEPRSSEREFVTGIENELENIKNEPPSAAIQSKPAIGNIEKLLRGLKKGGDLANTSIRKVAKGAEIVQKIADAYRRLAQTCGFEPTDLPF